MDFFRPGLRAGWVGLFFGLWLSLVSRAEEGLRRFTFERAEMGVPFRVTLFAVEETVAQRAAEAALHRVSELNRVLSDYESESELSQLSQSSGQGKRVRVGEDLWRVLEFGQQMAVRSGGAFDLTVGPVVNLWRTARRKRELPSEERRAEALGRVGYDGLHLFPAERSVELQKLRMRLDAGGIAKGYAVEEALKVLQGLGFASAMVVGGGDMALGEAPAGEMGWRIEVPALDEPGAPAAQVLTLRNVRVSTSGDRYQRLERDGKRYSHVLDPRTGMALTDHSLVTVIASHGMEAEVLAKILSVLGPEKGLPIVEEISGAAARLVRAPQGRVEEFFSERWPKEGR